MIPIGLVVKCVILTWTLSTGAPDGYHIFFKPGDHRRIMWPAPTPPIWFTAVEGKEVDLHDIQIRAYRLDKNTGLLEYSRYSGALKHVYKDQWTKTYNLKTGVCE